MPQEWHSSGADEPWPLSPTQGAEAAAAAAAAAAATAATVVQKHQRRRRLTPLSPDAVLAHAAPEVVYPHWVPRRALPKRAASGGTPSVSAQIL